jgi:hypothetical protein
LRRNPDRAIARLAPHLRNDDAVTMPRAAVELFLFDATRSIKEGTRSQHSIAECWCRDDKAIE